MELIVRHRGETTKVRLERRHEDGGERFEVAVGERVYQVDWRHVGPDVRSLVIGGRQHELAVRAVGGGGYEVVGGHGEERLEVLELLAHLAETTHAETGPQGLRRVAAYMPGRVVGLLVEEGAAVTAGQGVLVLEAMKMENEIQAESDGVVRRFFVQTGEAVEGGDPLYELES